MIKLLAVFAFLGIFVPTWAQSDDHKVPVTVYYESLCPDSRKFFIHQLYPSLQGNLSNYINLTLVPYGKSSYTRNAAGDYNFTCHHGPEECMGNRIQACALKNIDQGKPTHGLGYNRNAVGFINCLMDRSSKETGFPTKECAEINYVSNLIQIDNCAVHPDGNSFLAQYGMKTNALKPALTSVPTIVFNNEFKHDDSQLAQSNFVKALCQYIDHERPEECERNSASTHSFSMAALAVLIVAIVRSF